VPASYAVAIGYVFADTVDKAVKESDILSSVKDTLTETAAQVAETTGAVAAEGWRVAERFRLEEHVTGLEQEIERIKRKWGSASWASMDAGDLDAVRVTFERAKRTVVDLEAQLQQAHADLAALEAEDEAAEEAASSEASPPKTAPPPDMTHAPPVRSPPVAVVSSSVDADAPEPMAPRDQTPLADGKGGWHTSVNVGSKLLSPPPPPATMATMVFESEVPPERVTTAGSPPGSSAEGYLEDVSLDAGAPVIPGEVPTSEAESMPSTATAAFTPALEEQEEGGGLGLSAPGGNLDDSADPLGASAAAPSPLSAEADPLGGGEMAAAPKPVD